VQGIFTSYWVDYAVLKRIPSTEARQWQIPIGLQLVPAAMLGLGMFTLKESTRWLTKKGRHDEAWESLKWIRADESQATFEEMEEIRMGVEMERRATEGLRPKGKNTGSPIKTCRLTVYRTFRTRQLQTARHRINCLHSATSYWGNCFRLLWTPIFQASRWRWFERPSPHCNFWCRKSGRLWILRSLPIRPYWPS
jgi:hypothetical protein